MHMLLGSAFELKLRPINELDLAFLSQLYASTRMDELRVTGWSSAQKEIFLHSQFQLQHNHYQQQFAAAQFQILEINSNSIGRLYYSWERNNLRLIDIALLPDYRHQGIGGKLVRELMARVEEQKGKLTLYVDINNPARNWYIKLGFIATDDSLVNDAYQLLEWCSN
jgi:ribosomal protein S18 acetylase RimI-like enzyme